MLKNISEYSEETEELLIMKDFESKMLQKMGRRKCSIMRIID